MELKDMQEEMQEAYDRFVQKMAELDKKASALLQKNKQKEQDQALDEVRKKISKL